MELDGNIQGYSRGNEMAIIDDRAAYTQTVLSIGNLAAHGVLFEHAVSRDELTEQGLDDAAIERLEHVAGWAGVDLDDIPKIDRPIGSKYYLRDLYEREIVEAGNADDEWGKTSSEEADDYDSPDFERDAKGHLKPRDI